MVIIVSAYFKIKSKQSHTFYVNHLKRFLGNIQQMLVFFTTPDLKEFILSLRGNLPITLIEVESVYSIAAFQKFPLEFWKKQCQIDPEKYHTPELAAIWFNKKEFVMEACNIIKRDVPYIWCDAGSIRHDSWIPIIHTFGNNTQLIPTNKLLLQLLITPDKKKLYFKHPDIHIAGAIIAGYKDTWVLTSGLYDAMVMEYSNLNIPVNMDQYIWMSAVQKNPEHFEVIVPIIQYIDAWFFFYDYL